MHGPNRALEHLAGQGASPVDNSVDDNFSLNQHTNKISGRGDSSQVSFYISLVTITTLYSLSTKCFSSLAWKQFCLNSELCFEIKEQRLGRFMVRGNIPDVSEIAFLKKFRKRVLCFLLGRWFLLPVLSSESQGRLLWHNLCVCPAEGKVLVLEPLAEVPRGKLKFIFPNPLCKSACLPGSGLLPLPVLFCCCFSGSRAPPPASILKDEQSDPFSLLSNSHWLLCH